ncbi:MAG: hypothetical protein KAG89_18040 [Fulvimarina manganoxydans]|uniref:hypothetical protein n=1 Tax=Fulvimarina manganoxydans TaxID=937218 RepID=UPI002355B5B6|nr:hypothetical protein [Fulvimarina manganoxydans]MCK5934065.1 hypothetical protein [Fulvimarina manganoxydans]
MKIDRLKIVERLTGAGIEHENAVIAATKIGVAYDEAEQDMASKQDLDLIAERFETKINAAINRQILWTIGTFATFTAIILAGFKLLS